MREDLLKFFIFSICNKKSNETFQRNVVIITDLGFLFTLLNILNLDKNS